MKKNNLDEYKKYYSNSSEAYELDNTEPVINEPVRKKRTKRKSVQKVKKVTKYVYKEVVENNFSKSTYLTMCIIFLGCFVNLTIGAQVKYKDSQIRVISTQLNDLKDSNAKLELDVSNIYSLAEVETIAVSRLGMSKPQPHQIIHIDIEKSNYPSHSEATNIESNYDDEEQTGIKKFFTDIYSKIFG